MSVLSRVIFTADICHQDLIVRDLDLQMVQISQLSMKSMNITLVVTFLQWKLLGVSLAFTLHAKSPL